MSNIHKNPTISFRPSPYERKEIEARINASGLPKKIFYTRCCLYDRICVVGKKETILPLVDEVELLSLLPTVLNRLSIPRYINTR